VVKKLFVLECVYEQVFSSESEGANLPTRPRVSSSLGHSRGAKPNGGQVAGRGCASRWCRPAANAAPGAILISYGNCFSQSSAILPALGRRIYLLFGARPFSHPLS
jgi:hypothetical protein